MNTFYIKTHEGRITSFSGIAEALHYASPCVYAVCSPDTDKRGGIVWSVGRNFIESIFNHTGKESIMDAIKEFEDMDFTYWSIHPATESLYQKFMMLDVQQRLFIRYVIDENSYASIKNL